MKLAREYIQLAHLVAKSIAIPRIAGIHLPVMVEEAEKPDEFGFVFLEDGSAGPFYASLDDTLPELWQLYPDAKSSNHETLDLIDDFCSDSAAKRALALGAFNAMSQHIMARAGYSPLEVMKAKNKTSKSSDAAQKVAIVGYIRPMVEKFLQRGVEVLVLEKNPARVELQSGVLLSTNPTDLLDYQTILCTASTLINDSLGEILQFRNEGAKLSLIGPSGSGLPDILFKHGVHDVGGFYFDDMQALHSALEKQESWGHAGSKYQISAQDYPGVSSLLADIQHNQA